MNVTYLENQIEEIKDFMSNYSYSVPEEKFIRTHLQTAIGKISSKVSEIQMDDFYDDRIEYLTDGEGNSHIIPPFMTNKGDNKKVCLVDGSIMVVPKSIKFDEDGSFHVYMYVYLPLAEDKHVNLAVRLLGGDSYGDRIYVTSYFYKKLGSFRSYYSKDYAKNSMPNNYKNAVHKVVNRFRQIDTFENFNPKVKW